MLRTLNCPGQRNEVDGRISWEVKYCRQCSGVGSGLPREVELSGLKDFKDCGLRLICSDLH